jgi:methylmalonyl-CoA mutase C-terminal domain/subunit
MEGERPIRVLLAKTALDGHVRGIIVVATALRDAGMEVIYHGWDTPEGIVNAAIQEDVDVLGLNVGGSAETVKKIVDLLKKFGREDILIVAGGPIVPKDILKLKEYGIEGIFPQGSMLEFIVSYIKENARKIRKN